MFVYCCSSTEKQISGNILDTHMGLFIFSWQSSPCEKYTEEPFLDHKQYLPRWSGTEDWLLSLPKRLCFLFLYAKRHKGGYKVGEWIAGDEE